MGGRSREAGSAQAAAESRRLRAGRSTGARLRPGGPAPQGGPDHVRRPADEHVAVLPAGLTPDHGVHRAVRAAGRRVIGQCGDHLQLRARRLQPGQVGQVVQVGPAPGPDEQPDPPGGLAGGVPGWAPSPSMIAFIGAKPVPPAMHRMSRAELWSTTMLPRARQHGVTHAGVLHQGRADLPARNGADMQVQRAVGPGGVGDGVVPPDSWPPQDLHAQVLAGLVRKWLAGPDGEHGQIGAAPFVPDHLRDPPGRLGRRVLGGRGHHRADVADRRVPGGRGFVTPGRPVEQPQRGGQRLAEDLVVLFLDAVLPVVAAQLGQVLVQRLRVVHAPHAPGQRRAERPPLLIHGQREHGAQFRVGGEEKAVEIRHLPIGGWAGRRESLFQDCVIRHVRPVAELGTFFSGVTRWRRGWGTGGRGLMSGGLGLSRRFTWK